MTEETLFELALRTPEAERAALLARACEGKPELRARVEALLKADAAPAKLLEQPPILDATTGFERTVSYAAGDVAGSVIAGRYKLLEEIGEGGMGTVWMAQQSEPVKRLVAIKLIKAGMDSKAVLARFDAERQALAMMEHPNIAKVLDGGLTEDRRPYFVMELVKGTPITKFCDERKLSLKERLELFVPVCQAIQHAHQKGVIHRDIKPSNVLIALYDDKPVPKVIDFGVAKATGAQLTEQTLNTGFGAIVGTPEYMSPEQASLNNLDVDTRSDVYALGVLLYELLTGSTPVDRKSLKQAALMEVLRIIREDEPPRPSTKLSTAQALPIIAANRHIEPAKLSNLMKGELDWIVMKALEKDRSRRYETANGFAADVLRYLSGEPVTAVPPSTGYRLKKFVKRNRVKVIAAGLVLATLVVGIIGTTVGFFHAREAAVSERQAREEEAKQRQKAEAASERTRAVLDAMTSDVTGNSLSTQKEISGEQRKFLNGVIDYYRQLSAEQGHDVNSRARTAQAAGRLAVIEYQLGNKKEAIQAYGAAIDAYRRLKEEFPSEYLLHAEMAQNLGNRATAYHDMGELPAAQADYLEAAKNYEEVIRHNPQGHEPRHGCSQIYINLATLHDDTGDIPGAERWNQKAQEILEKLVQEFPKIESYHFSLARLHHNQSVTCLNSNQEKTAERHSRQAIEMLSSLMDEHPRNAFYLNELARAHNGLGSIFLKQKKYSEAEKQVRQSLGYRERLVMEFPSAATYQSDLAECAYNLGVVLRVMSKPAEGIEMHRKSFLAFQRLLQPYPEYPHYEHGLFMNERAIAQCYLTMKQEAESVPHFQAALASIEKAYAAKRLLAAQEAQRASCKRELFAVLSKLGRYPEADAEMKSGMQAAEALVQAQPGNLSYLRSLSQLYFDYGMFLRDRDRKAEAEEAYMKYVRVREREAEVAGPADLGHQVDLGGSYCNMGHLLTQHKKRKEALPWLDKAVQCLQAVVQKAPETRAAKEFLGNSYGNRSDAYGQLEQWILAAEDAGRAMDLATGNNRDAYRLTRAFYYARAAKFAEAISDIEELVKQEKFIADHWLEFATIYAKASETSPEKKLTYANRAMQLLSKAVEKGYADKNKLQTDPRLHALRQREDFKEMVEKMKEKGEGKP